MSQLRGIIRQYGNSIINLKRIISVHAVSDTKLEFVYPTSNWYSGSQAWQNDISKGHTVIVKDAKKELESIRVALEHYYNNSES